MSRKISNRDAVAYIVDMQPFESHTGNFSGWHLGRGTTGRLPAAEREQFYNRGKDSYVVYSYSTPIAWWDAENGWTIPAVRYSSTTSRHQHIVRMAVGK